MPSLRLPCHPLTHWSLPIRPPPSAFSQVSWKQLIAKPTAFAPSPNEPSSNGVGHSDYTPMALIYLHPAWLQWGKGGLEHSWNSVGECHLEVGDPEQKGYKRAKHKPKWNCLHCQPGASMTLEDIWPPLKMSWLLQLWHATGVFGVESGVPPNSLQNRSKSLLALDINNTKFETYRSILMCRYLSPVWLTESHILLEALLYQHSNPGHNWESQLNLTSPYTFLNLRRFLTHREDFHLPSTPNEVSSMVWSVASL